jgi:hypothetical protein
MNIEHYIEHFGHDVLEGEERSGFCFVNATGRRAGCGRMIA